MKLSCPNCSAAIASNEVNLGEGIAHCSNCNEYFKIAQYLRDDEEVRRLQKPWFSKMSISREYTGYVIDIPPPGWNGQSLLFLVVAVFWNAVTWGMILLSGEQVPNKSFFIPFVLIGAFVALWFFSMMFCKTRIDYNRNEIIVAWEILGLRYRKSRSSKNLQKITEEVFYTKNYQPVYGIGMFFSHEGKIKFGSDLKEEERKWLIGELYELKSKYAIDRGVGSI